MTQPIPGTTHTPASIVPRGRQSKKKRTKREAPAEKIPTAKSPNPATGKDTMARADTATLVDECSNRMPPHPLKNQSRGTVIK